MIPLTLILSCTLLGSLIVLLAASGNLALLLWCLPAAIALGVYHLTLAQKRQIAHETRGRAEAALLNRLSIKQNDLQCQKRWLTQYQDTPEMNAEHTRIIAQLEREIALLTAELDALHKDD